MALPRGLRVARAEEELLDDEGLAGFRFEDDTWTPKVCETMAFWAISNGFGPFFYTLLGSR